MKSVFPLGKLYNDPFERTILIADGHEPVHIFRILHTKLGKVLNIHSNVCPLSDLKTVVHILAQEISHFFIVELKVRDSHKKSTMPKMHTKCNVHQQSACNLSSLSTNLVENDISLNTIIINVAIDVLNFSFALGNVTKDVCE